MPMNFESVDFDNIETLSDENDKNTLQSNMSEAMKINPDQHAKELQLSKDTGVPTFAVDESVEQQFNLDQVNFNDVTERSPKTTGFLSDFDNSVVAQDDVDILQSIEELFDFGKTFQNIGETSKIGFELQGKGMLVAGADLTPDRRQDLMPFDMFPPGAGISPQEAQTMSIEYAENFGIETDEQLAQAKEKGVKQLITEIRTLQEERQQLTPEDLNLLEQGVRGGVESLINMAPGAGLMLISGGRAAPLLLTMGAQTYGSSYADARAEGLEPDKAQWFASINAVIEVGTEMLPTKTLETIIMGKSTGMTKAALKFAVQEMGTEQLATLGQSLNEYAFGLDKEMEAADSIEDMIAIQARRQAVTAIATVVAGGAQITAATGIQKGIQSLTRDTQTKETKGDIEQQKIDTLNEQSQKSKLRERDKESFKQFVQEADGENNTTVFIDGAQTALYMQSKTPEEIEADPALKMLSEQVTEASKLGGDVQIPVADFAADVAGTEHYDALRDSMTMSGETIAPFRQEQVKQETETYITKLMEEAQQNTSEYVEAQEIFTQVRDQLVDTGAVTPANASIMAQIVPAWATAQARRQGKTVQEVYQDAGLTIEGPQTGERARIAGEMILEQEGITTADLQTSLQEEGVDVRLMGEGDVVTLSKIVVPEEQREEGVGTAAMQRIVNWADANSKTVALSPSKDFGGNVKRLKAFYKSLGFVENKGKNKNLEISETMFYTPKEVTEDDEILKREDGDIGRRPVTGDQALIEEAKARTDEQALSEFQRAERGEEVTVVHRAHDAETKLNDQKLDEVIEKKTPSAYFGHYTGTADVGNAARHGNDVTVHKIQLKNPLIISAEAFESVTDGMTHEEAITKREFFKAEGHDGILVQGLNWVVAFESDTLTELQEEFGEVAEMFAQEPISTETEAFKKWFSNSKVVDENGDPLIVFHGTAEEFEAFDPDKAIGGQFWFTTDRESIERGEVGAAGRGRIVEAYLSLQNPAGWKEYDNLTLDELIARGYDGLALPDSDGTVTYVAFEPTQIKSPEAERFDPTEPSIFKQEARGYYNPANSVIRLSEAADLSTFLHEFAHFMYEMEVNGNTDMLQSINSWYKRNAEDVAKEANGYLGEEFDAEKQLEQPVFHGTPHKFDKFSLEAIGTGEGSQAYGYGLYFAEDRQVAEYYRGSEGQIVEADIPENSELLEWDRPLNEQSKTIINAFDEIEVSFYSNGEDFYKSLSEQEGGDEFASQYLDERGVPGLRYLDAASRGGDGTYNFVIWDENIITVEAVNDELVQAEIFAQPTDQPTAKEGSITPDDVVAFLDNDTTGNKDKDSAIRRAVHEHFARGFETYLMEGKAPSIELRNAFRTFARWLSRIYQSMKGQLNVNLDAEMRAVFDRLVATEDQIAAAEARAQVEPMFTDAAMAGMTEAEFTDYQKRQGKVKDVQSETLRDKLIKQLTRQTKKWWKEEKSDIVDEETESLKKERVYVARERLKAPELKLDHATVKEMAGEEKTDKLGRKSTVIPPALKGMTAKGQKGVHPDEAAAFLGYNSGSEMIDDLITAPAIKIQAETNAEIIMVDRHGDIFTDGTIEREADEAVQNEERGKLILAELKTLAKGTNAPTIDRATIKELAITNIGKLAFREIHPTKYRKAEVRAAQESATMLAEGNREGAAEAKLRQIMNYYLGMEATKAKNETVKVIDRMNRYSKKKVREEILKAENGYMDQIDKILGRFEFRKAATLKQVESINLWAKERSETDGDGLVIANAVLNESYVTHWKNVPFSDLQGINDSVKNIEHVARYANKIKMQQEEIDFNKLKSQWVDHINIQDQRFATKESRSRIDDSRKATTMEHIRKWASQLTKVPYLASWLDGGERAGLSHDILVQPFTDALDVKMRMVDEVALPVIESIRNRSKADQKRHMTKIWIPEIEDHLLGHQVLAVALNAGNQGNLKKMLLGEGWADPDVETDISIDNPQLQAVLKHMTKDDWTLVQDIWDQMDTLYPQLAEVHRRTTGLTPPKVEAVPIENEFGTFRGGYYPVKYSPKRSHKAEKNAEKREAETESMFNNTASIQASVNAGATNERTGFYDRINLSLEVVPDHFNETIHYITHHDAVRQVNRLTQAPDVANAITGVLGEEEFKQLKPWLNDIAKDGRQQPVKTYIDSIFQRLRFGTTLGIMGFKASTGIMQVYGLLTTVAELGTGPTIKGIYTTIGRSWYMKAVRKVLGSTDTMQSSWEFATEKSKVMNHRVKTMDREIRNAMNLIQGKRGFMAAVQEASMKHIALIQTYMVDLPTWHAAYSKELSESGDESKAVNYADWAVENLQGSGATKDMATILRNQSKLLTTMTMFMTFFSSLGNLGRDVVKGSRSGLYSGSTVAAKLMFLFTLPVFFEMLMRGELDEPEDEDDRLSKFLTQTALYPLTSIPFIRDAASGLIGDYGYNSSPVASVIEKGIQGYKQIGERTFTDEEVTKSAKKNASKLTGVILAVPGISQAWASGEHLYDVMENGEEFTVRELLFGPTRK